MINAMPSENYGGSKVVLIHRSGPQMVLLDIILPF